MSDASSDADLVRECLRGRLEAFETLVERYERPIFNVAVRMVSNHDDARDIAQTVFLKAYEKLSTFNPRYKFHSWIYRIAINESLNHLSKIRPSTPLDAVVPRVASSEGGPEKALEQAEHRVSIRQTLSEIKPDLRAVIVLKHYLGCSYGEISRILDVPEKTVKSRLFTARRLLKEALQKRGLESCA